MGFAYWRIPLSKNTNVFHSLPPLKMGLRIPREIAGDPAAGFRDARLEDQQISPTGNSDDAPNNEPGVLRGT